MAHQMAEMIEAPAAEVLMSQPTTQSRPLERRLFT
jgi:hypothetical protein